MQIYIGHTLVMLARRYLCLCLSKLATCYNASYVIVNAL